MDGDVGLGDQLRPDIDYDIPDGAGEAIFDLVGDLAGRTVLDVGCGLGPYRKAIESRGGRWIGLELSGSACTVIGDGMQLPFADGSFDAVLCAAVLEHLPEPGHMISEIHRVLSERGMIFGYASFLEPFHGLSYFHMSHMGLEYLLVKHGFRPLHIFAPQNGTAYQIQSLVFPRRVPVLTPLFGAILRGSFKGLTAMNRLARNILRGARGDGGPGETANRDNYRRLVDLRFGVGMNFVAERTAIPAGPPAGYRALVKDG